MTICAFTYYGEAIAKGRPRATAFKGRARVYTPARTAAFEGKVRAVAADAMARFGSRPTPDAVRVKIAFDRQVSKSWSRAKKAAHLGQPIVTGADIDNQVKAILDALNGVVWEDDVQVSDIAVSRRWAEVHAFRIHITEASGPGLDLKEAA
jgi:Holliday junction resolvase RusA-like endonuclease